MPTTSTKRPSTHTRSFIEDRLLLPLVEPVLHPSQWRVRALGLSTALGHPLFYAVWTGWVPQPYERLWQRLAASALGLLLLTVPSLQAQPPGRVATWGLSTIFWLSLPVYFTWMYLCNERNAAWFASMTAMFLIYYQLTDWRIATVGIATGVLVGSGLFELFGPITAAVTVREIITHGVVFSFAWYIGLMLGISSSNLRREQLKQALGTMGIMAHELRTPLSTMALIGDALRSEVSELPALQAQRLQLLTDRLRSTVRNMNWQIDTQIANARLMRLPPCSERVQAGKLVHEAIAAFPYRNIREKECVQVQVHREFSFFSSEALFKQVIDNLVKNALRALAALPTSPRPGDLRVEVDLVPQRRQWGRIIVADKGCGISDDLRPRLFLPFVSTNESTAHGLGLAFCQRVVHETRGSIHVESVPGQGARFILELPVS